MPETIRREDGTHHFRSRGAQMTCSNAWIANNTFIESPDTIIKHSSLSTSYRMKFRTHSRWIELMKRIPTDIGISPTFIYAPSILPHVGGLGSRSILPCSVLEYSQCRQLKFRQGSMRSFFLCLHAVVVFC